MPRERGWQPLTGHWDLCLLSDLRPDVSLSACSGFVCVAVGREGRASFHGELSEQHRHQWAGRREACVSPGSGPSGEHGGEDTGSSLGSALPRRSEGPG